MAIFTLQEVDEQIAAFKEALKALTLNQSYKIGKRELVRADIEEIRKTLEFLNLERSKLVSGAGPKFVTGRLRR
ncbi:DUF6148 family protein [Desulfoluna limicola]|uniref:DUF6148 family protein n=1 Tax=Desulfoluna limicola TaxID=2810562 RepID=UPI003BF4D095